MNMKSVIYNEFKNNGGILKTSQLNKIGLTSRQINRLIENNEIIRIKHGYYELVDQTYPEEVIIARLFPKAVIFLESALLHYGYTDRIPYAWQVAVDRNSEKTQYEIDYPALDVYYMEPKLLKLGLDKIKIEKVDIKIFDRDRTICDILRHENKLEREVFTNAIKSYVKDPNKNVTKLIEYAKILNIENKMQTYIGVWL